MAHMKGFIFTMDAVFALTIATIGIGILLYANFVSPLSYQAPVNNARSLLYSLLQQKASNIQLSSAPYIGAEVPIRGINPNGYAVFNGESSYITVKNLEYTGGPDTVSVWVYPTGTGQQMGLVSAGWSLVINSLGEADFISESGIGGVVTGKLVPGQWNMITVTISGSSNPGVDIYINGSSNAENSLSGSLDTGYEYQIGGISASPSSISSQYRYLGYMSDVQVYNTILSYQQISSLYINGLAASPIASNDVSLWLPLSTSISDHSSFQYPTFGQDISFGKPEYLDISSSYINKNDTLLYALGAMYLDGHVADADSILHSINASGDEAIMINNSYAPALYAADFNGANSQLLIQNSPNELTINQKFTLSVWIKKAGYASTCEQIIGKPLSPTFFLYSPTVNGCSAGSENGTSPSFTYATTVGNETGLSFSQNIPSGKWEYLTVTLNGNVLKEYVNGNKTATYVEQGYPNINSQPLYIGYGDSYFNGSIANIQLYNITLNGTQIRSLYNSGLAGAPASYSGLVGWWPLLGSLNDYSGNGNIGYANNVNFVLSNYTPQSLLGAYQISKASIQAQYIASSGNYMVYNISVVKWK